MAVRECAAEHRKDGSPIRKTRTEIELLICCARTNLGSTYTEKIGRLLQREIDWAYLFRMADRHGLRPLVYHHLNAVSPEAAPAAVWEQFQRYFHRNCRRNLLLTGELIKLLNLFEAHGIDAIPYKGPALAMAAYGNLTLRECGDLDILVQTADVLRAGDLLKARGYQREYKLGIAQEAAFLDYQYHHGFWHSESRITVEIHWKFETKYFSFPMDPDSLRLRLQTCSLGGQRVSVYSPEDIFLLLCVHGGKHLWERLRWICDLAEMVRVYPKMDWDRILTQARESRAERMLWLGVYLAHDLLDAALPPEVLEKMVADPAIKSLAEQVESHLAVEGHDAGTFETSLFHLKARKHWRDRVRYGIGLVGTPTGIDMGMLQLPPSLTPLYSVVRLARLGVKYCLGLTPAEHE